MQIFQNDFNNHITQTTAILMKITQKINNQNYPARNPTVFGRKLSKLKHVSDLVINQIL